ncbi:phospholipase A1 VesT1.02-like [Condylostylus longicornis]|uniref:phospholipase A1 VesT1.02-like n=1 Tax=Condylostylus longicornis TaxID=2530218 RepID=UPI00244E0C74|nr:phospholipase A1 VesT1.02-like [Condylostylus longicornis]
MALQFLISLKLVVLLIKSNYAIVVDSNNCIDYNTNTGTVYPNVADPKVRYYLFTQNNLLDGQEIENQDINSLINSNFDACWQTRIYIGGWKVVPENCKTALVKDSYLNIGNFNFIIADWSDWGTKDYIPAFKSVNDIGSSIGNFTKFLNNCYNVKYCDMYLIGQGMGAHIAGAAGNFIAPQQYNTIFALDPAGPGFSGVAPSYRLDPFDADYVESISTDMFLWGYGGEEPIGQAQFFPNNGVRIQPHCPYTPIITDTCSHTAAVDYFANSLNSSIKFCGRATTWDDVYLGNVPQTDPTCCITMGGEPSTKKQGDYYVATSCSGPFPS